MRKSIESKDGAVPGLRAPQPVSAPWRRPCLRGHLSRRPPVAPKLKFSALAAIYSALESSSLIEQPHLKAALAVWDYFSTVAGLIFNPAAEDEVTAAIRRALYANPDGLSRDEIRKICQGHISSERIDAALQQLAVVGAATHYTQPGRGRPAIM